MNAAIFFSGTYGSTKQYADWIADATGLPVFDIRDPAADPGSYDLVVLGSSIVLFKLTIRKWLKEKRAQIADKPIILFSVSGAGPGAKIEKWVANSLPASLFERTEHFALRGRLDHSKVSWWVKLILRLGAMFNRDPEARKDELHGFDYVDKATIEPVVARIRALLGSQAAPSSPSQVA